MPSKPIPFRPIFLLTSMLVASAFADDTIFGAGKQPAPVMSMSVLSDAPAVREHKAEVFRAADARVDALESSGAVTRAESSEIKGWFRALPFRRAVDIELTAVSGLPDMFGICLEGNPSQFLTIDACAATMVFLSSTSVHIGSRFLHYVNLTRVRNGDGSHSYSGDEVSIGPVVGLRKTVKLGLLGASDKEYTGVDAELSAEWVHWLSQNFGAGLQLDAGATFYDAFDSPVNISYLPNVKLSLGLSF